MSLTKQDMSARKVFEALSYSPLHWPGKTTCLDADSLEDYLQRPGSGNVSIAELYHENSKLHPSKAATLLAMRTDADQFRRETLERAAAASQLSHRPAPIVVPDELRAVLRAAKFSAGPDAFYAVELRLMLERWLLAWDPLTEAFTALKQFSTDDVAAVHAALQVIGPRPGSLRSPLLFVLGWFARNDLLLGARGYRRTLLEAGQMLQAVVTEARAAGVETEVFSEFTDVDVDRLVETDGVEQGTIAVIAFGRE